MLNMNPLGVDLVAIDGPAGVGKSTVAKRLAGKLGFYFLSSGMIYRAMALHLMQQGWRPEGFEPQAARIEPLLKDLRVEVNAEGRILANGSDVTEALRTEAISNAASVISTQPAVRDLSNQVQRETVADIGRRNTYPGVILEGRDIGTVVFPDASHKFFLTAREETRAHRRFSEQQAAHPELTMQAVRE